MVSTAPWESTGESIQEKVAKVRNMLIQAMETMVEIKAMAATNQQSHQEDAIPAQMIKDYEDTKKIMVFRDTFKATATIKDSGGPSEWETLRGKKP